MSSLKEWALAHWKELAVVAVGASAGIVGSGALFPSTRIVSKPPTLDDEEYSHDDEPKRRQTKSSPHRGPVHSESLPPFDPSLPPEEQRVRREVEDFFSSTRFVGCLDDTEVQCLYKMMQVCRFKAGETIFTKGDSGESGMYVCVAGELGVYIEDEEGTLYLASVITAPESVGDFDMLDAGQRSVTVRALSDARCLNISVSVFNAFVQDHPQTLLVFLKQSVARMWRVANFTLAEFLELPPPYVPDILPSSDATRKLFAHVEKTPSFGERFKVAKGDLLFQQDQACDDEFYLVLSGSLKLLPVQSEDSRDESSMASETDEGSEVGLVSREGSLHGSMSSFSAAAAAAATSPTDGGAVPTDSSVGVETDSCSRGERGDADSVSNAASVAAEADIARPGSIVGGMGFLIGGNRACTVVACEPCELLAIKTSHIEAAMVTNTGVHRKSDIGAFDASNDVDSQGAGVAAPQQCGHKVANQGQDGAVAAIVGGLFDMASMMGPILRLFMTLGLQDLHLPAGGKVYQNGEVADGIFVVISGRVRVVHEQPQGRKATNPMFQAKQTVSDRHRYDPMTASLVSNKLRYEVGRGQTLGEMAVITGTRHDSLAVCIRDSEFVRIPPPSMGLIGARHPAVLLQMIQHMARRFKQTSSNSDGQGHSNLVTIGLIPADFDTDATPFALSLRRALASVGPVLHLTQDKVATMLGERLSDLPFYLHTALFRSKVTNWIARQEENYRFILLEGEGDLTDPWTKICASQADCILLVGNGNGDPTVSIEEQNLLWDKREAALQSELAVGETGEGGGLTVAAAEGVGAHIELVLVHEKSDKGYRLPRGTRRWFDERPLLRKHHHIRIGSDGDYDRLTRHLCNRSVGVVLSGGGSRGLAHLGVLQAMQEAGIPVDKIGGTSQGAFMAAAFGETLSPKLMVPKVTRLAVAIGSVRSLIRDITIPMLSLFSGREFANAISDALGTRTDITDLWLPYFCVSTNVTEADMEIHTRGPLAKFVQASMTVVGLLPPVFDRGSLLVDGGYSDNLPVDVMRAMGAHVVIAVDVENKENDLTECSEYVGGISGVWLLIHRLCAKLHIPFYRSFKTPKYGAIVDALTYISHNRQLKAINSKVDLYIRPPVDAYQLLDYHLLDEISSLALAHAKPLLAQWRQKSQISNKRWRRAGSSVNMLVRGLGEAGQEAENEASFPPVRTAPETALAEAPLALEPVSAREKHWRLSISRAIATKARGPFRLVASLRRGTPMG